MEPRSEWISWENVRTSRLWVSSKKCMWQEQWAWARLQCMARPPAGRSRRLDLQPQPHRTCVQQDQQQLCSRWHLIDVSISTNLFWAPVECDWSVRNVRTELLPLLDWWFDAWRKQYTPEIGIWMAVFSQTACNLLWHLNYDCSYLSKTRILSNNGFFQWHEIRAAFPVE